jgi:hypothetical protein
MPRREGSASPLRCNALAFLVAAGVVGFAHLNLDPFVTGASPRNRSALLAGTPDLYPPAPELPTRLERLPPAGQPEIPPAVSIADDPATLRGVWACKMANALLQKGCSAFSKVPDYTATFIKQERIGGALSECQTIDLKVRHEPFSVYMKWLSGDRGRQLIYVHGQNEGHLLVQPGGIKGRLTGVLSLEPEGALALSESRYPITKAGLLELAHIIMGFQQQDLARPSGLRCELRDHQEFEQRPCFLYLVEYASPEAHATYRKSMIYVDKELSMPICVKNFTWAKDANPEKLDEETLIEFYAYTELRVQQQLESSHFDQNNSDYKLRVKR